MRTAAGVLLIIVATLNLFASLFYFTVGGAGKLASMAAEHERQRGHEARPEAEQNAEVLRQAPAQFGTTGGKLMAFGVYLLVTVGTSIAGAVCLFRRRAATFVIVSAALVILAEVISIVLVKFGWRNIPGLLASVFALIGARSIIVMSRPIDSAPPSPPGPPPVTGAGG